MQNLAGAQVVLRNGDPLTELKFGKSNSAALDEKTGEFNAYNKKDLINSLSSLMDAVSSGDVVTDQPLSSEAAADQRKELLASALADETGAIWASLGASLANQINEQANREGFLRKVSMPHTLRQGDIARIPMPSHNTIAVVATSASSIGYQTIRQKVYTPAEFEINGNVRVEQLDIDQVNGDLLEHAYNDGLQSIMVQEDVIWKRSADATVGVVNPLEYISGDLTPRILGNLRQSVSRWNLPVSTAVIANDYWSDIIGSPDFSSFLDPVTKYDLALNGQLGTLVGLQLHTDAFRAPNQRVLNPGDLYVVANPEYHAAYTTRGGVRSTPTSGADGGNSTRGWFLSCPFSFILANARSVAVARRV